MRCLRHTHLGKLSLYFKYEEYSCLGFKKIPSFQCEYSTAALLSDRRRVAVPLVQSWNV